MIRVTGPLQGAPAASARKTEKLRGAFRPEAGAKASGAGSGAPVAGAETLGALIALQSSVGEGPSGRAKQVAAAQRMLDLLDRLRHGLLDGSPAGGDLDALALAADARPAAADADPVLGALYDEIALRARVELAKRGR